MQSSTENFTVPKDYDEFQARYGAHIKKLLIRSNQFQTNFDDLHSYVWVKLLEAKFLERFQEYVERLRPKWLEATQVCDFLGVSWQQWVDALVASHTGKRPFWMPTPVNVAEYNIQGIPWYDSRTAKYAFDDILEVSCGEWDPSSGERYWAFEHWGFDVVGGVVKGERRPEVYLKYPTQCPTANLFKNYLNRAVGNHWANFCRTTKRRHKERPQNPQGDEGHLTSWEDTLVESKQPSMEIKLQLTEARGIMRSVLHTCLQDFDIPSGADEEGKIFALLEQGVSLFQALKQCGFPTKVRKSVIRSIRLRSDGPLELSEELE